MARIAFLGAIIAGGYGALHDQISYAISPEYFTRLKFRQFDYADFGWRPRIFASEVGFLGSWWVGLFAGWFLARAGLAELSAPARRSCTLESFAILLAVTAVAGIGGAVLGLAVTQSGDLGAWDHWRRSLELEDLRAFVIVAYLHAAGYLGALTGLVLAIAWVRRSLARSRRGDAERGR
jgi:hypothetical protein